MGMRPIPAPCRTVDGDEVVRRGTVIMVPADPAVFPVADETPACPADRKDLRG
ncbi:hypothetical protein GCM10010502_70560 [Kitasatospora aureofaciens]|uniref:Uncharacterized protein n=1 Tax=Kitasatospora aureofaciens TaxID=1894 RepID=A0A8H9I5B6_KITAU|nr:hypothetical protein GCM10010502_70560 [Kitasatospora aureofaciens]